MPPARDIRNLVLIGFMGTGKSTVGRLVARALHFDFVDTDQLIERRAGQAIPQIFAERGEAAFRDCEQQVVAELAGRSRTVIATGGGLGANPDHLTSLKRHALVVCLCAPAEVIWERVRHAPHRPLLQVPEPLERIRELLGQRTPVYRQADVLLFSGRRPSRQVADLVMRHFKPHRNPAA